jgi:hypothetical protein
MPGWMDTVLVVAIVGGALLYVGRQLLARVRSARKPASGAGCAGCDAHGANER